MISLTNGIKHRLVAVQDSDGATRNVCICQVKDRHTEEDHIEFPVFECPHYTRRYGLGTEKGINRN
jgi:hypothetical protein